MENISLENILKLYDKYLEGLKRTRENQRDLLYNQNSYSKKERYFLYRLLGRLSRKIKNCLGGEEIRIDPLLGDIEAEITYLLIRESKPKNMVEISPYRGWSTSWILNALKDNDSGKLYSYDLTDYATETIPSDLTEGRWSFFEGDIYDNLDRVPQEIDYLFLDSDHSAEFARRYIKDLFPRLKNGALVSVHDVFEKKIYSLLHTEGKVVLDWLKKNNLNYFTASSMADGSVYKKIMNVKKKLKIAESIVYRAPMTNSMIFFRNNLFL